MYLMSEDHEDSEFHIIFKNRTEFESDWVRRVRRVQVLVPKASKNALESIGFAYRRSGDEQERRDCDRGTLGPNGVCSERIVLPVSLRSVAILAQTLVTQHPRLKAPASAAESSQFGKSARLKPAPFFNLRWMMSPCLA